MQIKYILKCFIKSRAGRRVTNLFISVTLKVKLQAPKDSPAGLVFFY